VSQSSRISWTQFALLFAACGITMGAVTLSYSLPSILTAAALSGSGWNCTLASSSCTRSDSLAAGATYPPVTLTVNVSASAVVGTYPVSAVVSGGSDVNIGNNSASDPTTISVPAATTVTTSPVGLAFSVDGQTYSTAQTLHWTAGSAHTIAVASPQTGPRSASYTFQSRSDGENMSHTVTVGASPVTYTANFSHRLRQRPRSSTSSR
jgi:hypothetical protein